MGIQLLRPVAEFFKGPAPRATPEDYRRLAEALNRMRICGALKIEWVIEQIPEFKENDSLRRRLAPLERALLKQFDDGSQVYNIPKNLQLSLIEFKQLEQFLRKRQVWGTGVEIPKIAKVDGILAELLREKMRIDGKMLGESYKHVLDRFSSIIEYYTTTDFSDRIARSSMAVYPDGDGVYITVEDRSPAPHSGGRPEIFRGNVLYDGAHYYAFLFAEDRQGRGADHLQNTRMRLLILQERENNSYFGGLINPARQGRVIAWRTMPLTAPAEIKSAFEGVAKRPTLLTEGDCTQDADQIAYRHLIPPKAA